ncbi:MAG: 5'-methylthioadenosine nucleosidase [Crocinitomicaceae bacterium TMED45]|nr:MAG: 5'-methylthioadenosine nucleosidase [Crocinitomicaceae bacterium TMED45]|tara:strand:+ start:27 stop:572 length:546 start_codon:yes stop_codon:yes gene_type:complete
MINKEECVILVALQDELPESLLPEWNIVYTGVGKINATMSIVQAYQKYNPKLFINYGTAGSLDKSLSGLLPVTIFKQRDMDVTVLGFELGQTPYEDIGTISFNEIGYSCGTGDNFVTSEPKVQTQLVDMESYAYAKFCKLNNINFKCYKYVSDNADENASKDWKELVGNGANIFVEFINEN